MAILNADNYAKSVASPQEQIPVGDVSGKSRFSYDEYTFLAEFAVADVIKVCSPLPANARVINACVVCEATGATGILDLGILDGDVDYFISQADPGAAAVNKKMASEAGFLVKSASVIQPALKATEISAAATGKKIKVFIEYILE